MTDDFGVDLEEVFRVIETAEVLVIRFQIVHKRLLIDFRTRNGAGPLVAIVDRAESVEERFRSIKKLRPDFPYPERVMSFHWPRSTPVLVVSGVWQHVVDRVGALGGHEGIDECGKIMEELLREERQEVAAAIRGNDTYQTLWERQRA